ncbi:MAG TPA: efflux RND transporter periplasmic adaptor subunit [Blastocatellia bacterium]|nr:efflux RND transporter periplasmic adaptor subunit [Blastocatellia bacterium]
MKKIIAARVLLASLGLLAVSCGTTKQEAATRPAPQIKDVKIEQVALTAIDDYYEATGTVRSATTSTLSARVMGSVVALHAREGSRVKAGQVLIEIDNRDTLAQLQKARAGLSEAEHALEEAERSIRAAETAKAAAEANRQLASATLTRYRALLERRSVSPQEFDEVEARHKVAVAEADRAEKMVQALASRKNQALAKIEQARADISNAQLVTGYARITAPVGGIVTARHTDIGQMAAPGVPLLTVEDDSRYRLEAVVEESQASVARAGDQVRVRIDALAGHEIEGRVAEIVPAADPASRSFTFKIDLPGGYGSGLRSGLFGRALFGAGQRQAITVPAQAIVERGQLTGVFVVDESGIAHLRLIKPGKTYGERVEVIAGLNEGERIVTSRVEAVSDGSRIE